MSLTLNRLSLATIAIASLVAPPSFAGVFSWTPGNTDIVVSADSLQLTVDGITSTVQAFTAEINAAGTEADVLGPWPTTVGAFGLPVFGVDVRQLGILAGEQLGLIAQQGVGIPANGSDLFSGGLSPGFASSYSFPADAASAFHFAIFSFDQLVDIPGVTVDDVTNQERDIWMATGTTAPDFTGGFLSGLTDFSIVNSADDTGDGLFTHNLGATEISYLLVGAPPEDGLGPLAAGGSQFFIDSFNGTASADGPGSTPVPEPGTLTFIGIGLAGLAWTRRRKRLSA